MARVLTPEECAEYKPGRVGPKTLYPIDPTWLDGTPRLLSDPEDWSGKAISFTGAFRRAAKELGLSAHLSIVSPTQVVAYVSGINASGDVK
jgi:hypothetical protein